jgi:hypothetical protein
MIRSGTPASKQQRQAAREQGQHMCCFEHYSCIECCRVGQRRRRAECNMVRSGTPARISRERNIGRAGSEQMVWALQLR